MSPTEHIIADMDAAIAAQEAGRYDIAARKARSAQMRMAGLPDSALADERLTWKPDAIDNIVRDLERRAAAAGTGPGRGAIIQGQEIEYRRG